MPQAGLAGPALADDEQNRPNADASPLFTTTVPFHSKKTFIDLLCAAEISRDPLVSSFWEAFIIDIYTIDLDSRCKFTQRKVAEER